MTIFLCVNLYINLWKNRFPYIKQGDIKDQNHYWIYLTFLNLYISLSLFLSSSWAMWWLFRCKRCWLHHHPGLPTGVPTSPELSLGHHSPWAFATHRPQLQPALWDREAGLQVSRGRGMGAESCDVDKSLFFYQAKMVLTNISTVCYYSGWMMICVDTFISMLQKRL